MPLLPPDEIAAQITSDSEEPGGEFSSYPILMAMLIDPDKGLLSQIGRFTFLPDVAEDEMDQGSLPTLHQGVQSQIVALLEAFHKQSVRIIQHFKGEGLPAVTLKANEFGQIAGGISEGCETPIKAHLCI